MCRQICTFVAGIGFKHMVQASAHFSFNERFLSVYLIGLKHRTLQFHSFSFTFWLKAFIKIADTLKNYI